MNRFTSDPSKRAHAVNPNFTKGAVAKPTVKPDKVLKNRNALLEKMAEQTSLRTGKEYAVVNGRIVEMTL